MDAVLDSGGLTAWATSRPPAQLLELFEVVAASGGAVVVPTVTVAESTTGRQREDALGLGMNNVSDGRAV